MKMAPRVGKIISVIPKRNFYDVLSRGFITHQIWRDSELYQHRRALDVHVQRLRKKIESDVENPKYIVTVAGVGYKFQVV